MSKLSKVLHEISAGDLVFIALSKHSPVEWVDIALVCDQEILRTIHLGDGRSKTVKQSIVEYFEQEHRPYGIFRQHNISFVEMRWTLVRTMLKLLQKPLNIWKRFIKLFIKSGLEFNWENEQSIKLMLLKHFQKQSIKQLEESGAFVRLM